MQTNLPDTLLASEHGRRANEILRSCVHCGFCNATCPTYQLLGDELDGPRGRIYLIKDLLETGENLDRATRHLDRCLTCRACETTCPSGVQYGELLEIARSRIGSARPGLDGLLRNLLRAVIPDATRLRTLARLGRPFRWLLPKRLRKHVPDAVGVPPAPNPDHQHRVLLLNGCAQQVVTPATNEAIVELLDRHGVGVVFAPSETCCGSLDLHLGAEGPALETIKRNVDALASQLESVDIVLSSASGCGVTVKDYGRLLAGDPSYAEKAANVSMKTLDLAEYVASLNLNLVKRGDFDRVAWLSPCTLQHGQQITGLVEVLLSTAGYELVDVADGHLCCGSAGTYSILQPDLSEALKIRKLDALHLNRPDAIATANVGCQTHLQAGSSVPVKHWIELLK